MIATMTLKQDNLTLLNHKEFAQKLKLCTILYVEDDPEVRKYITEFLKRYCKTVLTTSTAEEALELYKEHNPEILLVDIDLPGMSGIDFIKLVRKDDIYTRAIISTAYTTKEFTFEAIELGLTRYLVKPIVGNELLVALEKSLEELEKFPKNSLQIDLGDGFLYNTDTKSVTCNDESVKLCKKEQLLLNFFIKHRDRVVTYESLELEVWDNKHMSEDAIRSQIRNIRKKTHYNILRNISGVGYRLYKKDEC